MLGKKFFLALKKIKTILSLIKITDFWNLHFLPILDLVHFWNFLKLIQIMQFEII